MENKAQKYTTPMMIQYEKIKEEYPDYLLFYRLGDFYELFADDALIASKALGIMLTSRGQGENKVPMCGVPFHAYDSYLAKLIKQGYKVAICEQMEDPKEAKKRGAKSVVKREIIRLVTQGTLTEDSMLDEKKNNYIACLYKYVDKLGVAWIDVSTGLFLTQEFDISGAYLQSVVSTILTRLSPAELVISDVFSQDSNVYNVLQDWKSKLSRLPSARFNLENAKKCILDWFGVQTLDSFGDFSKAEISAAGTLLAYIRDTQIGKLPHISYPRKINNNQVMEIDSATRKSLEILESCSSKGSSLLNAIDYTLTGSGSRLLSRRLASPSTDIDEINGRLNAVDFFIGCPRIREKLRDVLKHMPEIERALSRIVLGTGGPKDMAGLAEALYTLPKIKNILLSSTSDALQTIPASLEEMISHIGNYNNLATRIKEAFKDDLPVLVRDGNFIRPGYNAALDNLKNIHISSKQIMAELQNKYIEQTGVSGLKVKYNTLIGYFVEVPNKYAEEIMSNPQFIYRQSVLNATRYTTMELTELYQKSVSSEEQAIAMEVEIYNNFAKDIKIVADDLSTTAFAVAEIDVAVGMAKLAIEKNYCRPILDDSTVFDIEEGRHPVVENALNIYHAGEFIANSCKLDAKQDAIWLLTGPNMAGKSTFLRQNAIIAVMAQIGAYVPCKSAHIGIVNKLFSRVGASDDLAGGRSTFMVEMVETASILNQADEHSFVILDEIGRGTATFDGLSIAWAVMEYLHDINRCRAIFATHYHELTSLSQKLKHTSMHCMKIKEFNDDVVFLHEVISGAADRSYGIHVAKLAGLPKSVTNRAAQVLQKIENGKQDNITAVIDELPLFAAANNHAEKEQKSDKLHEFVEQLNPDDYSPREALEKLYELKQLSQEE